jgi:hypothetical protein
LFRCLALHPDVWHLRAESHHILEGPAHPDHAGLSSNRFTVDDVYNDILKKLRRNFYTKALNVNQVIDNPSWLFRGGSLPERAARAAGLKTLGMASKIRKPSEIRFLEKTPKNSLRVSFLHRLFPDAYFIWNKRAPNRNVDSLVAGWHASDSFGPFERQRFATYDVAHQLDLQDYNGTAWKFALVPEWHSLRGKRVADVAAWQYLQCNRYALRDFKEIEDDRLYEVKHEELVQNPLSAIRKIINWAGLPQSRSVDQFASSLPKVNDTRTAERDKETGLRYPDEVQRALSQLKALPELVEEMGYSASELPS